MSMRIFWSKRNDWIKQRRTWLVYTDSDECCVSGGGGGGKGWVRVSKHCEVRVH